MHHTPLPKAHELQSTICSLQSELDRLDQMGAGIAAIHVNAAIEQLRANLAIVNDSAAWPLVPAPLWLVPDNDVRETQMIHAPRD